MEYKYCTNKLSDIFYAHKKSKNPNDGRYNIFEIDNPNGWALNELEHLNDMGFIIEDDHTLATDVDIFNLSEEGSDLEHIEIYKTDEGYVISSNRKYIFETFNEMMNFIEKSNSDIRF